MTIWSDEVLADAYVGSINLEVSDILGVPVTLVRMPSQGRAISDSRADGHVSFADGFPYLLANMQSLHDLNQRLEDPVTMQHFRANIVIDGEKAYQEELQPLVLYRILVIVFFLDRAAVKFQAQTNNQLGNLTIQNLIPHTK